MVARNPVTQKSAIINPLICQTDHEKVIFQDGTINKMSRQLLQQESLFKAPPNETGKRK